MMRSRSERQNKITMLPGPLQLSLMSLRTQVKRHPVKGGAERLLQFEEEPLSSLMRPRIVLLVEDFAFIFKVSP